MKRIRLLLMVFVVVSVLGGIALFQGFGNTWINAWVVQSRSGPLHVYELPNHPKFLTDDLALSKATDAMTEDGFSGPNWIPIEDGRTKSPDGTQDKYLSRNGNNPNYGTIVFVNRNEKRERVVKIDLTERQVTCQLWTPK